MTPTLLTGTLPDAPMPALLAVSDVARRLVTPGHAVHLHRTTQDEPAATLYAGNGPDDTARPLVTVVGTWDRHDGIALGVVPAADPFLSRLARKAETAAAIARDLAGVPA